MEPIQLTERPCPVCGKTSYIWGAVCAQGMKFVPDDASLLAKFFALGFKLPARRCTICGNVQLFSPASGAES